MIFNISFKKGLQTISKIHGGKSVRKEDLTIAEWEKVLEIETLLEKLTGFRVHIEQVS